MNYFDQDFEDILEIVRREMGENAVVPVSRCSNLKYICLNMLIIDYFI